jgi:polysaccharide biosynthesis/export protein
MSNTKLFLTACVCLLVTSVYSTFGQNPPKTESAPSDTQVQVRPDTAAAPSSANNQEQSPASFSERYPRYRLCKGDSFDVTFVLVPEFNQTVIVQPDGYITLNGAGSLHVEGETIPQLMESIRAAYGKILRDPIVSIVLKDFDKPYFIAGGQVTRPGKYDLRGDPTVVEAIAVAGGFNDNARHSQVLLFRRVSDGWTEARILNLKKMLNKGNLREDAHLLPGDMIFVPKSTFSKIQHFIPTPTLGTYFPIP